MASEGKTCNRKTIGRENIINKTLKQANISDILDQFCGIYFDNFSKYVLQ